MLKTKCGTEEVLKKRLAIIAAVGWLAVAALTATGHLI